MGDLGKYLLGPHHKNVETQRSAVKRGKKITWKKVILGPRTLIQMQVEGGLFYPRIGPQRRNLFLGKEDFGLGHVQVKHQKLHMMEKKWRAGFLKRMTHPHF